MSAHLDYYNKCEGLLWGCIRGEYEMSHNTLVNDNLVT